MLEKHASVTAASGGKTKYSGSKWIKTVGFTSSACFINVKSCFGGQKRSRVSDLSGVVISVITTLCASMDEVNYKRPHFSNPFGHFGSRELTDTMDSLVKKKTKQC